MSSSNSSHFKNTAATIFARKWFRLRPYTSHYRWSSFINQYQRKVPRISSFNYRCLAKWRGPKSSALRPQKYDTIIPNEGLIWALRHESRGIMRQVETFEPPRSGWGTLSVGNVWNRRILFLRLWKETIFCHFSLIRNIRAVWAVNMSVRNIFPMISKTIEWATEKANK